ncbi:hypothetical protein Bca52824_093063 [Brassica carinata]|uniref:Uncharacterized protein n=1 Tax=Brassica carinata TaxID=52824 RepID=A0A8X7P846_BRACI|nr:hypothetical protein Bca52824_093063 [Brassica carinata]
MESDPIPSTTKVSAHVDVATVDPGVVPGVDTALPSSEAPPLATAYDGSCSASPKQTDQPNACLVEASYFLTQPSSACSYSSYAGFKGLDSTRSTVATETVSLGSKECPDITSIDSQGCILLDHEESDLSTKENSEIGEPRSEVTTVSVVTVNTPTEDVSLAKIPTTNVMAASSSYETFEQFDVSNHVDSSPHSPPTSEAFLGKVDNVVDTSFSSPSSVPFVHKNLFAVLDNDEVKDPAAVPALDFLFSITILSFCGRPLKPSQRLKEMEWFTAGKGKRGRGRGPHH